MRRRRRRRHSYSYIFGSETKNKAQTQTKRGTHNDKTKTKYENYTKKQQEADEEEKEKKQRRRRAYSLINEIKARKKLHKKYKRALSSVSLSLSPPPKKKGWVGGNESEIVQHRREGNFNERKLVKAKGKDESRMDAALPSLPANCARGEFVGRAREWERESARHTHTHMRALSERRAPLPLAALDYVCVWEQASLSHDIYVCVFGESAHFPSLATVAAAVQA